MASTASYGASWIRPKQITEIMISNGIAPIILLKMYFNKNDPTPYFPDI
jgi:hypothetical protein